MLKCFNSSRVGPDLVPYIKMAKIGPYFENEKSRLYRLRKDSNPLIEAISNYQLLYLEAYIVYIDILWNEVAYKLTPDTIGSLIKSYKDIHCVNAKANTYDWPEKEQQRKKLHEDFIQAIVRRFGS